MTTALFILGVLGLVVGVGLGIAQLEIIKQLRWLKAVLIPFFANLAQFLNPDKK